MICKITTLGTNSITVKGTHHPWGTNYDVIHKFSTCPPPPLPATRTPFIAKKYHNLVKGYLLIDNKQVLNKIHLLITSEKDLLKLAGIFR